MYKKRGIKKQFSEAVREVSFADIKSDKIKRKKTQLVETNNPI